MKKFTDKINENISSDKIPTAVEFLQNFPGDPDDDTVYEAMIEFAKLHVREAVKAQIRIENDRSNDSEIEKLTDLALSNTYPLENIK